MLLGAWKRGRGGGGAVEGNIVQRVNVLEGVNGILERFNGIDGVHVMRL